MKFGLYLPNFGPFGEANTLADLAFEAEQSGWDGFFLWDHIARPWTTNIVDPWVALAVIAARTERITIGPLITPLARRRPWKVARETVSIDHLSNGRLILGVGLGSSGGSSVEWSNFGEVLDLKQRGQMLDEALAVLVGLWSGERFSYQGQHYQINDSQFLPKPVQSSRIPIWVAGYWPNKVPFRRAARWDGVFPLFGPAEADRITQFGDMVRYVKDQREVDTAYDVVFINRPLAGNTYPSANSEMIVTALNAGATWWFEDLVPQRFGQDWQDEWPMAAMRQLILAGPPG